MKKITPKPYKNPSECGWETVIDFTKINSNGVSGKELLASLSTLRQKPSSYPIIQEPSETSEIRGVLGK